jgi:hypothetical protein
VYNFKEGICVDCAQFLCWILGFCPTQLYVCYIAVSYMYSSVLTDHQTVCEITTGKYFCELLMYKLHLRSHKISYTPKMEAVCYSKISLSASYTTWRCQNSEEQFLNFQCFQKDFLHRTLSYFSKYSLKLCVREEKYSVFSALKFRSNIIRTLKLQDLLRLIVSTCESASDLFMLT